MASSGKFDLSSSSSPGRPLYTSGKRGSQSHTAPSMERSTSFRENIENPILSSLPSMSRSTVNVSQGEVTNFFQCLRFDLKSMAAEYKCNRFGDFKRLASAALCAPDDSPSGLLKGKFPSSSPENIKRLKVGLRESTIKARERVKIFSDVLSVMNKCFPSIPSRKRSRPEAFSVGKMGTQSHALTSGFDYEQQKVEERGKNVVPNKRTRTSMVDQRADVRPNTPARSSGSVDRDREVLRLPNSNVHQGEERVIPVVADGWEKAKMKKKRTGMKADASLNASSVLAKPIDGIRDSRVHPRSLLDARSRLNDSHGFRPGTVNVREDFISGTPSSTPKLHTAARGPRSGTGGIPKLPHGQRATVSNGVESQSPHGTNKNPGAMGPTNRKRASSTQSSSPPVTQWAERRPQKMSRTARRTSLVPVVSNDDVSTLGNSDATVSEKRRGFAKRFPKQFKSKVDRTLSESEESGAAEVSEEKGGLSAQKMSNLVLSTRKNKFISGFASARSIGTAKQLKSGRVGVDKPESKLGRPPTRKLSGRKAYMRQKHSSITAPTDFLVTSDDGNGELLAAANAVINPNPGFVSSSPFWKQMDRLFGFVYDADVAYIKQEGSLRSTVNTANSIDYCDTHSNGSFEPPKSETECSSESSEHVMSGTSLCQRLLAALISEEDDNDYTWHGNDVYESAFEPETDGSFLSSYRMDSPLRSCNEYGTTGSDDCYKGLLVSEPTVVTCSQYQYGNMSMDERLLMEIHSLGLYPSPVPDLVQTGDEDVSIDIRRLEEKHHQQVSRKKSLLNKLLKSTEEARELHEKEFEQLSLEKLTRIAYHKYMNCWGPNAPGGKGVNGKMAKQLALECVKQTLDRCHEFETTGKSCFSEPLFMDMFLSGLSHFNDNTNTQQSPSLTNFDLYPPDALNHSSDQGKEDDVWPIRGKKRELYLDDVAGTSTSSGKGKRSDREREREGKGNGIKNGGPKIGRPTVSGNGERKSKAKIKQKTSQVSSVPIPVAIPIPIPIPKVDENEKNECMLLLEDPLDLSHLQLPEFDVDVGQGQDIGSWLNIGDEVLQDDDFLGLEIPMDDLTDLNMMV